MQIIKRLACFFVVSLVVVSAQSCKSRDAHPGNAELESGQVLQGYRKVNVLSKIFWDWAERRAYVQFKYTDNGQERTVKGKIFNSWENGVQINSQSERYYYDKIKIDSLAETNASGVSLYPNQNRDKLMEALFNELIFERSVSFSYKDSSG